MNKEQTDLTTGKQIRHLRIQSGMTQEELAGELNVTRQALSNWERDVNEPGINMLKKICFLFTRQRKSKNMRCFIRRYVVELFQTINQSVSDKKERVLLMNDKIIQWHPAFVAAMDLELNENRNDLEYHKEYNLNTKPLEVDLLLIKKNKESQIVNEIGKLFRGNNIIEYKSPEDSLDIDMFYKAGAYASLYKSYGKSVDERKADDITVTIFREIKPMGLFAYFKSHNIRTTNPYSGIYYVLDSVLFPTQIIVGRELDKNSHVWLRDLSDRMQKQEMKDLLEKIDNLRLKLDKELADSVLEVSIRANWEIIKELRGDENMCQALLEIMEPEIDKIKNQIKNETKIRMIIELGQEDGLSAAAIIERLQKKTGVSYEMAEAYFAEYRSGSSE